MIDGVLNVRDLGGHRAYGQEIRRGLILRTAALDQLTEQGAASLAELGLRTVIDLRTAAERDADPNAVAEYPQLEGVRQIPLPLVEDFEGMPDSAIGSYLFMLERGGGTLVTAIRLLAEPEALPAIVHCAAGKDRTGLVIALLLGWLGVDYAVIEADYLASNEGLGDTLRYPAKPEALAAVFDGVREQYGSIEEFFEEHGFRETERVALRHTLLKHDFDPDR